MMHILRKCIVLLIVFGSTTEVLSKKSYSIRGNRIVCKNANKKFLLSLKCSMKLVSREIELYSGEGILHPNVTLHTLHVRMVAYLKFNTVYRPLLLDTRADVCGIYSGATKHVLLATTHLDAVDENISLGCPISGRRFVRDVKLYHAFYPDVIPVGTWRLDHELYTKDNGFDEPLLVAQMFFVIAHNDTELF